MVVVPVVHPDNNIHDRCPFNVPMDQLSNQKLHHHQKVMQTQIGFDGHWSDRSLPFQTMLRIMHVMHKSPKFSVHSVHKRQGKAIWQTLKKLSHRSSFIEPFLQSHICEGQVDRSFFRGERSMQST
jgi:hypothetical protein